jgi:hypothetical protein
LKAFQMSPPPSNQRIQHIISQKLKNAHTTTKGQGTCYKGVSEAASEVDPIMQYRFQNMIRRPLITDPISPASADQVLPPLKKSKKNLDDRRTEEKIDKKSEANKDDNIFIAQLGSKALNTWLVLNGESELNKREILFEIKSLGQPVSIISQQNNQQHQNSIHDKDARVCLDTTQSRMPYFLDENLNINKSHIYQDIIRNKISCIYNELCAERKNVEFRYHQAFHEDTVHDIVGKIQSTHNLIAAAKEREHRIMEESKQLGL